MKTDLVFQFFHNLTAKKITRKHLASKGEKNISLRTYAADNTISLLLLTATNQQQKSLSESTNKIPKRKRRTITGNLVNIRGQVPALKKQGDIYFKESLNP